MRTKHVWAVAMITLFVVTGSVAAQTATPPNPLSTMKRLKCDFPVLSSGTWENGEPNAQVKKAGVLSFQFTEIDTTESTANVTGLASSSHIVAQLSGWNLHFLDIRPTGSLTITTVFAQESRAGKFKAVHTRTDYLPVSIPGFVARPDVFQYYGECGPVE